MRDLGRLLRLIGGERRWIVLAALAAAVTLGSGVGLVATSSYLISRAALVDATTTLALAITFVRLFAVLRATARYVERYVGHLGTFRILTRIRVWFFRSVTSLGPARLSDERRGDLVGRVVGDVDALQDLYLRVVVPPLAAAATTVAAAVVVGYFDLRLGVVLAVFLLVGALVVPLVPARRGRPPADAVARARARRDAEVTESLAGLDELLLLGEEERVRDTVRDQDRRIAGAERLVAASRGTTQALGALLSGGAAVAMVAGGVALVADGRIEGVHLALLPLVALVAFEAVTPLAAAPEHLHRSRVAARRLFALVDEPPEVTEPAEPAEPPVTADLVLDDVGFHYRDGGPDVLDGVALAIPDGTRAAVVGSSGSGKSTLVSLLLRFHDPSAGRILLGGVDLRRLRTADLRERIAVVAQEDHLFDTTVRDNLLLAAPDADDDRLLEALDDAGLGDVVRTLPGGLDERVGERGARLSGGERQQLMIARALLRDAPVLVLDEATAHLDPVTERAVLLAVARRRAGRTTVTISHHAASLDGVDLVVELDRGRCRTRRPGPPGVRN